MQWDNWMVYKSYVWSLLTYNIFQLKGKVPKTIMSDEIANVSQFCELS